eukprot:c19294_g1_i4 orf=404-940(-)
MATIGFDAYRFSISWSRIMPDGRESSINQEGISFYNNLINALLEKGITPVVTLYHYDLPQALEDSIGGWLSPEIANHFALYAEICFREFGDRVKHWVTLNEAWMFATLGYRYGLYAPGRCSNKVTSLVGDSTTEPIYKVMHHALLSHAAAVDVYNRKFKGFGSYILWSVSFFHEGENW